MVLDIQFLILRFLRILSVDIVFLQLAYFPLLTANLLRTNVLALHNIVYTHQSRGQSRLV